VIRPLLALVAVFTFLAIACDGDDGTTRSTTRSTTRTV